MRQKPQDLAGPLTTTPQATLVDTFAPGDLSLAGKAPVQQELLDFSTLSNAAKKLIDQRTEFNKAEGEKAGLKVGSMLETGATDAEAYAAIVESGDTPRTIAAKFAKAAKSGKIDAVDIPGFKVGLARAKGAFVAGQMKSTAESLIPKYAAQHSQLPPGDDEAEDALIREAFNEMRGANQEDLDKLDFFGNQEAEPMLQDLALTFLGKVRGESRALQMEQRKDLVGVRISELATSYMDAATSDEEQADIIAQLGAMEPELRLEGIDGKALIAEKAIAAAGSLALTEGWEKAGEFLEKVHLNARGPAGDQKEGPYVFRNNPNMDLLRAIDQAESKVDRERDQKPQKLAAQRSEAVITFENAPGTQELLNLYSDPDPDAIRTAFDSVIQRFIDKDESIYEEYGMTPETAQFAPGFLRDMQQQSFQRAANYQADKYQAVRTEVFAVALDKSPREAIGMLAGADLPAPERYKLGEELRAMENSGTGKAWSNVMQHNIIPQIYARAAATLPKDSPLAGARGTEEVARFVDAFMAGNYGDTNPLDGPMALKLGADFLDSIDEKYALSDVEAQKAKAATTAAAGNTAKAEKFLNRTLSFANDLQATKDGVSSTIIGGVKRDSAPDDLLEFEEFLVETPARRRLATSRDLKTGAKRVEQILGGNLVPADMKNAAATEAMGRLGGLSLEAIISLDPAKVRESYIAYTREAEAALRSAPRYQWGVRVGGANVREVDLNLDAYTEVDLSQINPEHTPLNDYKDAAKYLIDDPTDPDKLAFNPQEPLPPKMRAEIERYYDELGVAVDDQGDVVKNFLYTQSLLWK